MAIPEEIKEVVSKLEKAGFKSYIVGGCVRDFLREATPKDWDVATKARPEQIKELFEKSYLDNNFGTVTVQTGSLKPGLKEIEVTPFRTESSYSDKRHPDKVEWAGSVKEDLARRDFTVNAMAMDLSSKKEYEIIDLFKGKKDLEKKLIKAVNKPEERFSEDALRMMRAVRFASTLDKGTWEIEEKTAKAIKKKAELLSVISKERVRDELMKVIMSDSASEGIELLRKMGLLKEIIPELEQGCGVGQNKHHIFEVYDHNLRCLGYAAKKSYNKYVRLAALMHDIAKPICKQGQGPNSTFYGHEVVGARMTSGILKRLKFSNKDIEKITKLVRYHLFYYNVGEVSEASVRKLLREVGKENMEELLQVRYCDRIGSGVPKAEPYKLRHLKYVIEKVLQHPLSVKMLRVSGQEVMDILKIKPGPKVGQILDILLGKVLQDPEENKEKTLVLNIKELGKLPDEKIAALAEKAREERKEIEMKRDEMTKKKYWVS